jgi:hypothetical protein
LLFFVFVLASSAYFVSKPCFSSFFFGWAPAYRRMEGRKDGWGFIYLYDINLIRGLIKDFLINKPLFMSGNDKMSFGHILTSPPQNSAPTPGNSTSPPQNPPPPLFVLTLS